MRKVLTVLMALLILPFLNIQAIAQKVGPTTPPDNAVNQSNAPKLEVHTEELPPPRYDPPPSPPPVPSGNDNRSESTVSHSNGQDDNSNGVPISNGSAR
jgi:hypothetical protein